MPDVFQLLEVKRTEPGKKSAFVRIRKFGEIHRDYQQQDAIDQAERCLDYLEV